MRSDKIASKYKELQALAEGFLRSYSEQLVDGLTLEQASAYSLFPAGKLFRSTLHLASGDLFGLPPEVLSNSGLALELIHTATLVHDDLPAIDNDDLRRGRPSSHIKYGEPAAILVGDRLISAAFGLVAEDLRIDAQTRVGIISALSQALVDVCDGQLLDLQASGQVKNAENIPESSLEKAPEQRKFDTLEELELRHGKKTGALIRAAVLTPLCFLSADEARDAKRHLSVFGLKLGLMFQVVDDILDVTGTTEQLGKNAKSDERRSSPNYVSVFGIDGARKLAERVAEEARDALGVFGQRGQLLEMFIDSGLDRST